MYIFMYTSARMQELEQTAEFVEAQNAANVAATNYQDAAKNLDRLSKALLVRIYTYVCVYIYTQTYIYIYVYMYIYM